MSTRRVWCKAGLGWMGGLALAQPARATPLRAVGSQFARIFEGSEGQAPKGLAVDLLGTAQTAIEELINRYIRPEQTKGRRRKPYGYRRRTIYL